MPDSNCQSQRPAVATLFLQLSFTQLLMVSSKSPSLLNAVRHKRERGREGERGLTSCQLRRVD